MMQFISQSHAAIALSTYFLIFGLDELAFNSGMSLLCRFSFRCFVFLIILLMSIALDVERRAMVNVGEPDLPRSPL